VRLPLVLLVSGTQTSRILSGVAGSSIRFQDQPSADERALYDVDQMMASFDHEVALALEAREGRTPTTWEIRVLVGGLFTLAYTNWLQVFMCIWGGRKVGCNL